MTVTPATTGAQGPTWRRVLEPLLPQPQPPTFSLPGYDWVFFQASRPGPQIHGSPVAASPPCTFPPPAGLLLKERGAGLFARAGLLRSAP